MIHTQFAIFVFSVIELLCIVAAVAFTLYGYSTTKWNLIKAEVVKYELSKITIDDRSLSNKLVRKQKSYIKNLIYEYAIEGIQYKGRNIYVFGFSPVGGSVTDKFIKRHGGLNEGQSLKIYVNQNDHRQAVVEKGIPTSMVLISISISAVCFFSTYVFSNFLSKYKEIYSSGSIIGVILGALLFIILYYKGKSAVVR